MVAAEPTIEEVAAQIFGEDKPPAQAVEEPASPAVEEPKPDPVAERVAARIAIARRADLRAAGVRKEIESGRAEVERKRAELAPLAELAEQVRAAKLSPSKALELLGTDAKTFLETLANEHEPAAVAQRVASSANGEVEKYKARVEALEKRLADDVSQRVEHDNAVVQKAFLEHVAGKADVYPHLVGELTPDEIVREGWRLAGEHARPYFEKFGVYPDDDVIAEYLESQAKARAEQRGAWRERIGKNTHQPSEGKPTGDLRATQPEKGPSPRTLTSRAASEKATASPKWSQEQADEESLRILNGAFKAG